MRTSKLDTEIDVSGFAMHRLHDECSQSGGSIVRVCCVRMHVQVHRTKLWMVFRTGYVIGGFRVWKFVYNKVSVRASQVDVTTDGETRTSVRIRKPVVLACTGPSAEVALEQVARYLCDKESVAYSDAITVQFVSKTGRQFELKPSEPSSEVYNVATAAARVILKERK
jgi:hypothetical protein